MQGRELVGKEPEVLAQCLGFRVELFRLPLSPVCLIISSNQCVCVLYVLNSGSVAERIYSISRAVNQSREPTLFQGT